MAKEHNGPEVDDESSAEFQREANQPSRALIWEVAEFLLHNKKWWLTPIIIGLLLIALLLVLSGSGLAPFIYPLF